MLRLDLRNRSTTDIVVLLFTMLICSVMLIICSGTIIAKIIRPDMEVTRAAEAVNNMLSTIIGALVGFISGQHYGRNEQLKKDFPTEQKTGSKK
jgi:TRAP-type C4-dicarboxylate transport system permease small subunit